jgi:tRNA (guanine37-N1)-methyltransferase
MYARVDRERAESVRRILLESGVWDSGCRVLREEGYVFFPVSGRVDVSGVEFVEREGISRERLPQSIRESLEGVLTGGELDLVPSSFDVIGDICVLELPEVLVGKKKVVGTAVLDTFKNIKVVLLKTGRVGSEFRVPSVEVIAGENRTETVHTEHGLRYKLDVARVYFSPRLSGERLRVAGQVAGGERVLVMFAGVGPYAVLVSRLSGAVVSAVELNPVAVDYLRRNVLLNKVKVDVYGGDVREVVPTLGVFDRIVMPLPKDSSHFLDVALPALRKGGVVHYYVFAGNTLEASGGAVESAGMLGYVTEVLDVVECGSFAPGVSRFCVDFKAK